MKSIILSVTDKMNYKGFVNEYCQKNGLKPEYRLTERDRKFYCCLIIDAKTYIGDGHNSKQEAETQCAKMFYDESKEDNWNNTSLSIIKLYSPNIPDDLLAVVFGHKIKTKDEELTIADFISFGENAFKLFYPHNMFINDRKKKGTKTFKDFDPESKEVKEKIREKLNKSPVLQYVNRSISLKETDDCCRFFYAWMGAVYYKGYILSANLEFIDKIFNL